MNLLKKVATLAPKEAVIEKVYFKYGFKKFVAQYYPSKPSEKTLWGIKLKDGTPYYLGKFENGVLTTPSYDELRHYQDWSLLKGADRLYRYVENYEKFHLQNSNG